jgi:hypothetical protein
VAEKLLLLGIGYTLGAWTGRERLDELIGQVKHLAERDEVKMVINLALGFLEERVASRPVWGRPRVA